MRRATRWASSSRSVTRSMRVWVGIGNSSEPLGRVADRGDRPAIVGCMKHRRAGDDRIRPGLDHLPGIVTAQAAIDLNDHVEAAFVAEAAQCRDLWQHLGEELLATETGIDGH